MILFIILFLLAAATAFPFMNAALMPLMQWNLKRRTPHITQFEPLSRPETLADAKILLMRSRRDDYVSVFRQAALCRFLLFSFFSVAACFAFGYYKRNLGAAMAYLPLCVFFAFLNFMSFRAIDRDSQKILEGRYFESMTKEEILQRARNYADEYNAFERSLGRIPVEPGTLSEDSGESL